MPVLPDVNFYYNRGKAHSERGDYGKAIDDFTQAKNHSNDEEQRKEIEKEIKKNLHAEKKERKTLDFNYKKGCLFYFIFISRVLLGFVTAFAILLPFSGILFSTISECSLSEQIIQIDYAVFLIIAFSLIEWMSYRKRHEFAQLEVKRKIQETHIPMVRKIMKKEAYKDAPESMRLEALKYHLETIKEVRRDARTPLEPKFILSPIS